MKNAGKKKPDGAAPLWSRFSDYNAHVSNRKYTGLLNHSMDHIGSSNSSITSTTTRKNLALP